ncbi:MAG TPA: ABC transporter permease [Gemmatimonadaceae bacterium]|nr:ABC transporter permease [Gemmatimonadaceae bacterium]
MLSRILKRLRKLVAPRRVAREIEDEMRLHIQMEAEDLVAQGVAPDEAQRRAKMAFGGVDRYTEEARDAWPLRFAQRLGADLRFAVRSLMHAPSFTIAAVMALAIGMGANATIFSAIDSVAFRPLAVRDPDQLVALYGSQGEANLLVFSYPSYKDIERGATAFSGLVAFTDGPVGVSADIAGDRPVAMWAYHTSENYFSMLGVEPALGKFFGAGDLYAPVVVLSDALWNSRFGRDRSVIGRTLRINGNPFTIIGVAPAQFTGTRLFTYDPALWIPVGMHAQTIPSSAGMLEQRAATRFHLIGRLRDGVGIARAQASVDGQAQKLAAAFPDQYRELRISAMSNRTPINPWLAPPERINLIGKISLAGSLLVLLIACANVSSLLVARTTTRRQEMAVRLSLGASRGRLLQQMLTESFVLAALGALAAFPVHLLALSGMRALSPELEYASTWRPTAEPRLLMFGVLLTCGAALLFGLGPALQAAGRSFVSGLREAGGRTAAVWTRFREALVVGQAMVSVLVLVTAGLFARSLQHARTMDVGFPLDGAVALAMHPELTPSYDAARTRDFYRTLNERIAALPGVTSSARAGVIPLDGTTWARRVYIDGGSTDVRTAPVADLNIIAPGFLATLGTPIVEGREFIEADTAAANEVVIVNETLARRLWPDQSAIGKIVRVESPTGRKAEIIGVARNATYRTLGERPRSAMWMSLDRNPRSRTTTLVRTNGSEAGLIAAIGGAVRAIDPALPVVGLRTLRQHLAVSYVSVETGAVGAAGFGVLALLLAASGVFGLTAYTVSQRRREIGIRVALGARRASVMKLVAGRALILTLSGALSGALIASFVPMGFDAMLFGVAQFDITALTAGTALFGVIGVIAALVAARRAVRLDPAHVLRLD